MNAYFNLIPWQSTRRPFLGCLAPRSFFLTRLLYVTFRPSKQQHHRLTLSIAFRYFASAIDRDSYLRYLIFALHRPLYDHVKFVGKSTFSYEALPSQFLTLLNIY
jgi:hypothetical protein